MLTNRLAPWWQSFRRNASRRPMRARRPWLIRERLELENLEDRCVPSVVMVDTLSDAAGHAGTSLRDAIAAANPNDTIQFAANLSGAINLSTAVGEDGGQGMLTIGKNLTIQGHADHSITIEGGRDANVSTNAQVFKINPGFSATLEDLVISNGYSNSSDGGGGIDNYLGTLNVTDCIFNANYSPSYGGAISSYSASDMTVTSCTFNDNSSGQGGAIYSYFGLDVTGSTFLRNSAHYVGGGIYVNGGTLTVASSVFDSNATTYGSGGGIYTGSGVLEITGSSFSSNTSSDSGAGIYSYSSTTISDSTFTGNATHGFGAGLCIYGGTTSVTSSAFSENNAFYYGGAIYANGSLSLANSTFLHNSGYEAGAVYGSPNVTNCTFSQNIATSGAAGAIYGRPTVAGSTFDHNSAVYYAGAIYFDGAGSASDSSFYANSVPGGYGGGVYGRYFTLTNDTFAYNSATYGGGVYTDSSGLLLTNDLLAQNTGGDYAGYAASTASANNLIQVDNNISGLKGINNNLVGPDVTNVGLDPTGLQSNGGRTQTIALMPGSQAIDGGNDSVLATLTNDQRGFFRKTGAAVDIGAYEQANVIVVTTTDDGPGVFTPASGSDPASDTTLRGALANTGPGDTIRFSSGLTGSIDISFTGGGLGTFWLYKDIAIDGSGASITIDGGHNVSIFSNPGVTASLNHLIIVNGYVNGYGGAIWNQGAMTITDCTFKDSKAEGYGGAIGSRYGSLVISNCTFSGNQGWGTVFSDSDGAGNTLIVTNSTFANNSAGGIVSAYTATITNCTIANNAFGISNWGAMTLTNTLLAQNSYFDYEGNAAVGTSANNLIQVDNGSGLHGINGNIVGPDVTFVGLDPNGLQDNGGWSKTIALVPGSQAINAGTTGPSIPPTDERGIDRVGAPDIGAFESRGFNIAVTGGTPQAAPTLTPFGSPLEVAVSSAYGEPVAGGQVTFTPPASGPAAVLTNNAVAIGSDGTARAYATANAMSGSYLVSATGAGIVGTPNFALTNTASFALDTILTGLTNSSAAWGDYDNDGRLDILISGYTGSAAVTEVWHNNGDGTFTKNTSAGLTGISTGDVAWGDYDNDGRLDVLLSGYAAGGILVTEVWHNNGDGTFTKDSGAALTPLSYSCVAWGDYDNDGRLDILISGYNGTNYSTEVWHNNGDGTFSKNEAAPLTGVYGFGSVAWGDYDNDGRLDILLSGNTWSSGAVTEIWHNNGDGSFSQDTRTALTPLADGSVAWGDYDNDGHLDILLSGNRSGSLVTEVWHNNGDGTFTKNDNAAITGVVFGSVAWGDYNNDGRLDILLSGTALPGAVPTTQVWQNNGDGTFTRDNGAALTSVTEGTATWGDYDNDGRLDIVVSGSGYTRVYHNAALNPDTPPGAPTGLTATVGATWATLQWTAPADGETPSSGLSYNLIVGTTPGGSDIVGPMADAATGQRLLAQRGMINGTSYTLTNLVPTQTYYWSVQAIDPSLAGSPFATGAQFTIPETPSLTVTTLTDENNPDDGTISLREALAYNEYLGGGNTVTFDPTLSGAINLNPNEVWGAQGTLNIYANVIIQGPSDNSITIEGGSNPYPDNGDNVEVFYIGSGLTVEMDHLVIANGYSYDGGGIYNDGATLTLRNSTITGNSGDGSGGGIFNYSGTLNIENSAITNNYAYYDGGGIASSGQLNVSNSTIAGNTTDSYGGGIANSGDATLTNSTLRGNSAWSGGGIANSGTMSVDASTFDSNVATNGYGGGIANSSDGTLTIRNASFASNSTNGLGGGIYNDGSLGLTSSTLASNWANSGDGGGIFEDANGILTLNNVLLAENSGDDYAGYAADPNSFNNLIRFDSGSGLVDTEQGNIIRTDANAGLDPNGLQFNGGPTQTIALLTGYSDAIGHGLPLPDITTDQRGVLRPATPDIGAYQTLVTITPMTLPSVNAGIPYSETLTAANGTGPYAFAFSPGFDDLPATLTLDSDGTLHGTPTLGHTYQFLVSATDAHGISGLAVVSLEVVPVITPSSDTLLPGATLVIYGAGFDPDAGQDQVQLFSNGVALDPSSYYLSGADPNMLLVNFNTAPTAGVLTAIVTVNGASSAQTQVAAAAPAVSENANDLYANETSLTISGDGFDASQWNNNSLALACNGNAFTAFTITDVTNNSITVSFTAPPIGGMLTAVVTVNGVSSGDPVQVARVVPLVTEDTTLAVLASDTSFVIHGYGFDPNKANDSLYLTGPGVDYTISAATDSTLTVTFNTPPIAGTLTAWVSVNGVDSPYSVQVADVFPVVNVSTAPISVLATSVTITGVGFDPSIPGGSAEVRFSDGSRYWVRQTDITATSITLDIDIGSPLPAGPMTATVEVNGNLSADVQVATVVPLVTENTDVMPANQTTLIIHGQGFNSDTTHDSVTLTCNGTVLPSSAFSITNATDTSLELTFTSPPIAGVLKAAVTVNGGSAEPVQVATVTPVVTANTDNLPSNASTVTIHGFGFDPTAGNNTVSFSSGTGHVTTATTTQITVTFDTAPLVGPLTATVTVNTLAAPTQTVATVVSPVPVHVDTDFNGDHKADIANYYAGYGTWWVSLSTGSSFITTYWGQMGPATGWNTLVGDFNGDGKSDLANYYTGSGTMWVSISTGNSFYTTLWGQLGPAAGWTQMVGDFNGDGKSDIANYYNGSGTMWISLSMGNRFSTTLWGQLGPAAGWTHMVGDFNGDGKSDIANYYAATGTLWVSASMGNRFSTSLWAVLTPASGWTRQLVGDFNGDAKADMANYNGNSGTWWVSISTGTAFSTTQWAQLGTSSGWTRQIADDYNGDGLCDIANFFATDGSWWVSRSLGSAFQTTKWS